MLEVMAPTSTSRHRAPSAGASVAWGEFQAQEPALASVVAGRLAAHLHHVLATVRRDGSPRLSGTEVTERDGELFLGMMPGSRKAADLRVDPRFALHSAPVETDLAVGDARLAGRAVEITDPVAIQAFLESLAGHSDHPEHGERPEQAGGGERQVPTEAALFRLELSDVSLVRVEGDELVVELWRPGSPVRRIRRR